MLQVRLHVSMYYLEEKTKHKIQSYSICQSPNRSWGHSGGTVYSMYDYMGQKTRFICGKNAWMHLECLLFTPFSLSDVWMYGTERMNNDWVLLRFRLFPPGLSYDFQDLCQNDESYVQ